MKSKRNLSFLLALGLLSPLVEPVTIIAENNTDTTSKKETSKAVQFKEGPCTGNPDYSSKKKAYDQAKAAFDKSQTEKTDAETVESAAKAELDQAGTTADASQTEFDAKADAEGSAKTELDTAAGDLATAETEKNEADANVTATENAKNDAQDVVDTLNDPAKKDALEKANETAKADYESAKSEEEKAKDLVDQANRIVDSKKQAQADAQKAADKATDTFNEKMDAYNDAAQAKDDAQSALDTATSELEEAKTEQTNAATALDAARANAKIAEKEQAVKDAETKISDAEQAVKDAQAEVEAASKAVESGLKGFFEYYGATGSLEVLSSTVHPELVGKDSEPSAFNLENVKRSIELINELNEIRKSEGLPEFKVSDELFAVSACNADIVANSGVFDHVGQPEGADVYSAECMGYDHGPDERSIYVGMYYQEKERYENWEAFKNDYNNRYPNNKPLTDSYSDKFKFCGHYMILSDPDYQSVGISKNSTYGTTVIDLNPELIDMNNEEILKTYTVSEWTERFNTYYDKVHGDLTAAQEKLAAAQAQLEKANAEKDSADKALADAKQSIKSAEDKVTECSQKVTDLETAKSEKADSLKKAQNVANDAELEKENALSAKTEAESRLSELKKEYADAVTDRDAKETAYETAVSNTASRKADAERAQAKVDELAKGIEEAEKTLKAAIEAYNSAVSAQADAQKKLDDATAAKKAAEEKYSRAKSEKDDAGEALEVARQAEAEKQAAYDTAKSNADRKREAAKNASEALSTAENALNALDHSWDTGVITVDATCTEEGVKVYTCENCGDTVKEYLPALGHDYAEEWTVDKEPTFAEEGSESRHCTRCDEVTDVKAIPVLTFTDVDESTPHTDEVMWLAKTGVSKGWTEIDGTRTFRPYVDVARCDMAAFIRRLAKNNNWLDAATWTPDETDWNTFTDIDKNSPHAEDVLWLAHSGISEGWTEEDGAKTFRPLVTVARCDMAAFLQRLASKQGLSDASAWEPGEADWAFADIDAGSSHAKEVLWLAHSGVSKGWSEEDGTKTFRPYTAVARCDMAAFLRRLVG